MLLQYYFDFSCPYAYLGSTQIEALAERTGAQLEYRPMLLGGVFRAVDMPDFPASAMPPAKARHNAQDMMRWANAFGVPLRMPAGHPNRTVRALRALLSLPLDDWAPAIRALFATYWVEARDISRPETVAAALGNAGLDEAAIQRAQAANDDPAIKEELRERTDEAIARGVFGAPTMFVGSGVNAAMFWGQDRLFFVERALQGWRW